MPQARWTSTHPVEARRRGLARRLARGMVRLATRLVVFTGDTPAVVVTRITVFVVGWGALLGLLLWSGYHQGRLHGIDGVGVGLVLTVLAVGVARRVVRPGVDGRQDPF